MINMDNRFPGTKEGKIAQQEYEKKISALEDIEYKKSCIEPHSIRACGKTEEEIATYNKYLPLNSSMEEVINILRQYIKEHPEVQEKKKGSVFISPDEARKAQEENAKEIIRYT